MGKHFMEIMKAHKSIEKISFSKMKIIGYQDLYEIEMSGSTNTDHGRVYGKVSRDNITLDQIMSDDTFDSIIDELWENLVEEFNKDECRGR